MTRRHITGVDRTTDRIEPVLARIVAPFGLAALSMFELPIIRRFSTGLVSSVLDSGHPVDEYVLSDHCDLLWAWVFKTI
jgi:hypothetical protein